MRNDRKKITSSAKLKAAIQEERRQKWRKHFKNLHRNPSEITNKPAEKI